jgi:hypothetical protein
MSVYVGALRACLRNRNWRWGEVAHLFADSEDELTAGMRKKAVHAGAIEVGIHLEAQYIRAARAAAGLLEERE